MLQRRPNAVRTGPCWNGRQQFIQRRLRTPQQYRASQRNDRDLTKTKSCAQKDQQLEDAHRPSALNGSNRNLHFKPCGLHHPRQCCALGQPLKQHIPRLPERLTAQHKLRFRLRHIQRLTRKTKERNVNLFRVHVRDSWHLRVR
jgi:hypothetical protein